MIGTSVMKELKLVIAAAATAVCIKNFEHTRYINLMFILLRLKKYFTSNVGTT